MKNSISLDFSKFVLRTIETYNRYRSPIATAKLLKLGNDGFTIIFEGSFCQSCGVQDYFEDFIYELGDLCSIVEVEIDEIEQTNPESFKVHYKVKNASTDGKLDEEALFQEFLQENGLSVRDYAASNPCTKDVIKFHFRTWLFEKNSKKKRAKPRAH